MTANWYSVDIPLTPWLGGRGELVVGQANVVVFILKQDWSYLLIVDVLYDFFADCGSYFFHYQITALNHL